MSTNLSHGIPDSHTRKHGTDYSAVWDALNSPTYRVLDEEGRNVAAGQVRHLLGRHWLYVDETDGYSVIDDSAVEYLILETE